jgi:hypothetical protein
MMISGSAFAENAVKRMRDQPAGIVDHKGVAGISDLDRSNHLPDQFQIDVGDGNAGRSTVTGDGDGHVGL